MGSSSRTRPSPLNVGLIALLAALAVYGQGSTAEPPRKKGEGGVGGLIAGLRKPKLPELRVIKRFADPAYPKFDPSYVTTSTPQALFSGGGPLQARWKDSVTTLQATMDKIVAAGPRPQQRVTVVIASSDLSNAAALDSGTIILTSTLLDHLQTMSMDQEELAQDYVAFILAHEYAHVLMKHQQLNEKARLSYENMGNAVRLAGMVYVVARSAKVDKAASQATRDKEMLKSVGILIAVECASDLLHSEAGRAFLPGFAKETERDADMLAVDLSRRVGRDPVEGARALRLTFDDNRRRIQESTKAMRDAQKLAADTAKQIVPLLPVAAINGNFDDVKQAVIWLAAMNALNLAMTWLDDRAKLEGIGLHDNPNERLTLVKDYVTAFPKEADITVLAPLKTDFKTMALELKGKRAADQARNALLAGDVPAARTAINTALTSPVGKSAEVQEIAASVAMAERNYSSAITYLREVLKTYPAEEIYLRLAKAYRLKEDRPGALKVLADGAAKTRNPGPFLAVRIEIHREANAEPEVQKALAECRALGEPRWTRTCEELAKPPPPPPEEGADDQHHEGGTTPGGVLDGFLKRAGVLPPSAPAATPAPASAARKPAAPAPATPATKPATAPPPAGKKKGT